MKNVSYSHPPPCVHTATNRHLLRAPHTKHASFVHRHCTMSSVLSQTKQCKHRHTYTFLHTSMPSRLFLGYGHNKQPACLHCILCVHGVQAKVRSDKEEGSCSAKCMNNSFTYEEEVTHAVIWTNVQHRQIDVHLVNVGLPNNAFDYCLYQTTLMDGCQPHRHVAKQSTKYAVYHTAKTIQFSACQCTQVVNSGKPQLIQWTMHRFKLFEQYKPWSK